MTPDINDYLALAAAVRRFQAGKIALMRCEATQTPAYWDAIQQISSAEVAIYEAIVRIDAKQSDP